MFWIAMLFLGLLFAVKVDAQTAAKTVGGSLLGAALPKLALLLVGVFAVVAGAGWLLHRATKKGLGQ